MVDDAKTVTDMSAGELRVNDRDSLNDLLADNQLARRFRHTAFSVLGVAASAFFLVLLIVLARLWFCPATSLPQAILESRSLQVFLGVSLFILAAVPLSLSMALVRLSTSRSVRDPEESVSLTTPALELLRAMIQFFKAGPKA